MEREDLLRKVAECAPKEMGAHFMAGQWDGMPVDMTCVGFGFQHVPSISLPSGPTDPDSVWMNTLTLKCDIEDAAACFLMLDAMEEAGWIVGIENYHLGDAQFPFYCHWRRSAHHPHKPNDYCFAESRAEGLCRAFVAVFPPQAKAVPCAIDCPAPGDPSGCYCAGTICPDTGLACHPGVCANLKFCATAPPQTGNLSEPGGEGGNG